MSKQKHEDTSLEKSDDVARDIVAAEARIVSEYLDRNVFDGTLSQPEKALYDYVRRIFSESLDSKQSANPVFGALIERIARTGIMLERFEKLVILAQGLETKATMKGSSYITLLDEHRKCIETFCNVKWAYDTKKPKRTLEELRKVIFEEKTEIPAD